MCETLISLIVGLSDVSDGDVYELRLKRLQEECEKATPKGSLVKRLMEGESGSLKIHPYACINCTDKLF